MRHKSTLNRLTVLAAIIASGFSYAETSVMANVNVVSEYRFRGIDQTWGGPALQGGVDWSHTSGAYAGAWASNVERRSYPGGDVELDLYAGYNGKISEDWGYTLGAYAYVYPGANVQNTHCPSAALSAPCPVLPSQSYETLEFNAGVSWKSVAYKLSASAGDYFGANSRTGYSRHTHGTLYHDITVSWPLQQGFSMSAHAGYTDMAATLAGRDPSYADWRLTLTKAWSQGWTASISAVGASQNSLYRPPLGGLSAVDGKTRALNKDVLLIQLGKTF